MLTKKYLQIKIIEADNSAEFQDSFNSFMEELGETKTEIIGDPKIDMSRLQALITYRFEKKVPECLKDEYELRGVTFCCKDCECFIAGTGEYGICPHYKYRGGRLAEMHSEKPACDIFWNKLEKEVNKK